MSEDTNVVTSTDMAKKTPTSFRDLNKAELLAAAEFFGTKDEGTVKELREDLEASGVTWEAYCRQFNVEHWENEKEPVVEKGTPEKEVQEVKQEVVTAAPRTFTDEQKYLIKFIGKNPYFEFGKYRFTQDKPYGVMNARDAQNALVNEPTKFRQAYPAELQEFYS